MDLHDALRYIQMGIALRTDGMRIVTEQAACIEGQRLTTWAVLPGGERVSLGFASDGGDSHRIVLPIEVRCRVRDARRGSRRSGRGIAQPGTGTRGKSHKETQLMNVMTEVHPFLDGKPKR